MKRIIACLMAMFLLLNVGAAEPLSDDALLILAEVMAENVDLAAESDELHRLYSTPDNLRTVIATWAEGDHREPSAVYRIVLDESMLSGMISIDGLSSLVVTHLMQRALVSMITTLNAAYGTENLAASSITAISTGFAGTTDCSIYVLCYDAGADVAVCFYPFDGGTSGAYATFLAGDFEENHLEGWLADVTVERLR